MVKIQDPKLRKLLEKETAKSRAPRQSKLTKYDVSIQWTDRTKEPGYQETSEIIVIDAPSTKAALDRAMKARPRVSVAQLLGLHGTNIALQGPAYYRSKRKNG